MAFWYVKHPMQAGMPVLTSDDMILIFFPLQEKFLVAQITFGVWEYFWTLMPTRMGLTVILIHTFLLRSTMLLWSMIMTVMELILNWPVVSPNSVD